MRIGCERFVVKKEKKKKVREQERREDGRRKKGREFPETEQNAQSLTESKVSLTLLCRVRL